MTVPGIVGYRPILRHRKLGIPIRFVLTFLIFLTAAELPNEQKTLDPVVRLDPHRD